MKQWFVLLALFKLTRSAIIYSMYNISCVPPLEKVCGLTRAQITAAQKSTCNNGDNSLASKNQPTDVLAACKGEQCVERQRELVDCLTYETIAGQELAKQLALDVRSLACQLSPATEAKERSMAALFGKINQLDSAFGVYRKLAAAADATAHALAEQRNVVREARACMENIRCQLVEAKAKATAEANCNMSLSGGQRNFGLYVSGCLPVENEKSTCDDTDNTRVTHNNPMTVATTCKSSG